MDYVQGGYKTLSLPTVCNVLSAYNQGHICWREFRTFIGVISLSADLEAAARTHGQVRGVVLRDHHLEHLAKLTRAQSARSVCMDVRRLVRVGVLRRVESRLYVRLDPMPGADGLVSTLADGRSHRRRVPFPRRLLRALARERRPALAKVAIAYCIRGLSFERGTGRVKAKGAVKASWIAQVMLISIRAAKQGRADLIEWGLISRDDGSTQRKLNRDGAYFAFNLAWETNLDSAPQPRNSGPESAPPIERPRSPIGSKDQDQRSAGVSRKPSIRNVRLENLARIRDLDTLFRQAQAVGLVQGSEADALNFVGAAVRARRVPGDPTRVFMGIVRRRLWHHVDAAQEERARLAIAKYRLVSPEGFRIASRPALPRRGPCRDALRVASASVGALIRRSLGLDCTSMQRPCDALISSSPQHDPRRLDIEAEEHSPGVA